MSSKINDNMVSLEKGFSQGEAELYQFEVLEEVKTTSAVDHVHANNELAYKGDDSDGQVEWTKRSIAAAIFLCSLYASSQMVVYFVGGGLSYIVKDLHSPAAAGWLPVANTLANAAAAPFAGYLQDLLGRRYITLAGLLLVILGCALIGTANNLGQALGGLAVSGIGAAICELTALAGLSDIVPVKHRGYMLAVMTLFIVPIAPYILMTQVWSSHSTWRWGLRVGIIWNGIVLIGIALTYFPMSHPRMEGFSRRKVLARIDYVGAVLSIVGITIFLVALQSGGQSHSWTSAYVLCQLLIGVALLFAWLGWEWKVAEFPLLPMEIFRGQYVVGISFLISFVAGLQFYSLVNFFPLAFSTMYEPDPIQIGLKGLGFAIGAILGAAVINILLSARWEARNLLFGGIAIMTAFTGALACTNPNTPRMIAVLGTFAGVGTGAVIIPATTIALIVVPDSLLATTAAWSQSLRVMGGSVGYSIYYNIFANKLKKYLPAQVAEYVIRAGLPPIDVPMFVATFLTKPEAIASVPGYSPAIAQAAALGHSWGFAKALQYVWYASIPFGLVAMGSCLLIPSIAKYQTKRIAVKLG